MFSSRLKRNRGYFISLLLGLLLTACQQEKHTDYRFRLLNVADSGVNFTNTITESDSFNILNFHYIYNGGGVGVADFNQDGLADLVFSGNQVAAEVYLNQGELNFEDITASAGIVTSGRWSPRL